MISDISIPVLKGCEKHIACRVYTSPTNRKLSLFQQTRDICNAGSEGLGVAIYYSSSHG